MTECRWLNKRMALNETELLLIESGLELYRDKFEESETLIRPAILALQRRITKFKRPRRFKYEMKRGMQTET